MPRFDVTFRTSTERFSTGFCSVADRFDLTFRGFRRFNMAFRETSERFTAALRDATEQFDVDFTAIQPYADVPAYDGPYTFTPSLAAQTAQTAQKIAAHNIVINPIPSNYGLITWNGSTLTVS